MLPAVRQATCSLCATAASTAWAASGSVVLVCWPTEVAGKGGYGHPSLSRPYREGSAHVLQSSVDHCGWHTDARKAEQTLQELVKVLQHAAQTEECHWPCWCWSTLYLPLVMHQSCNRIQPCQVLHDPDTGASRLCVEQVKEHVQQLSRLVSS